VDSAQVERCSLEHKLERKATAAFSSEDNEISGYAAVFNVVDRVKDIILPGAFKAVLTQLDKVILKYMHGSTGEVLPIGVTTELREDGYGLFFKADIIDTTTGTDILKLVRAKIIDEASFSFRALNYEYDTLGHRIISEIDFGPAPEITVADHGSAVNPSARISATKAFWASWDTPTPREDEPNSELVELYNALKERYTHE